MVALSSNIRLESKGINGTLRFLASILRNASGHSSGKSKMQDARCKTRFACCVGLEYARLFRLKANGILRYRTRFDWGAGGARNGPKAANDSTRHDITSLRIFILTAVPNAFPRTFSTISPSIPLASIKECVMHTTKTRYVCT